MPVDGHGGGTVSDGGTERTVLRGKGGRRGRTTELRLLGVTMAPCEKTRAGSEARASARAIMSGCFAACGTASDFWMIALRIDSEIESEQHMSS